MAQNASRSVHVAQVNQICSRSTLQEMYITKFESLDETLVAALQRDIDEYAPGIKIIAIRVTKPRIPKSIKENYEAIESERTKLAVAEQTQRLVEKQAETERKARRAKPCAHASCMRTAPGGLEGAVGMPVATARAPVVVARADRG